MFIARLLTIYSCLFNEKALSPSVLIEYWSFQAIKPDGEVKMTKTIKTPASTKDSGRVKVGGAMLNF